MHNEIINQLSAYLDGELSPEERARVDAHVAACDACRAVLDDLKAIVVTAPYYEGEAPKRDVWAGIQAGISEQKEIPAQPATGDRRQATVQPRAVDRRLPRIRSCGRWLRLRCAKAVGYGG